MRGWDASPVPPTESKGDQLVPPGLLVSQHPSLLNGNPQQDRREGRRVGCPHRPHSFLVFGNLLVLPSSAGGQPLGSRGGGGRRLYPGTRIGRGTAAALRVGAAAGQGCLPALPAPASGPQVTGRQRVSLKRGRDAR